MQPVLNNTKRAAQYQIVDNANQLEQEVSNTQKSSLGQVETSRRRGDVSFDTWAKTMPQSWVCLMSGNTPMR